MQLRPWRRRNRSKGRAPRGPSYAPCHQSVYMANSATETAVAARRPITKLRLHHWKGFSVNSREAACEEMDGITCEVLHKPGEIARRLTVSRRQNAIATDLCGADDTCGVPCGRVIRPCANCPSVMGSRPRIGAYSKPLFLGRVLRPRQDSGGGQLLPDSRGHARDAGPAHSALP